MYLEIFISILFVVFVLLFLLKCCGWWWFFVYILCLLKRMKEKAMLNFLRETRAIGIVGAWLLFIHVLWFAKGPEGYTHKIIVAVSLMYSIRTTIWIIIHFVCSIRRAFKMAKYNNNNNINNTKLAFFIVYCSLYHGSMLPCLLIYWSGISLQLDIYPKTLLPSFHNNTIAEVTQSPLLKKSI